MKTEQTIDFAVEFEAANRYRDWLASQCTDMGSSVVQAGAKAICRRHQEEIRGLEGAELEKMVETLWLGYVSEARMAMWAMLRATEGIYPVAQATPTLSRNLKTIDGAPPLESLEQP